MKRFFITALFSFMIISSTGDDFCGIINTTFIAGERITFKVFYNVIGLYVDAGSAQFSINSERFNNKGVYHVIGDGFSNPSYDWIFKVRDRYETYIDTVTLKPYKFIRNVD